MVFLLGNLNFGQVLEFSQVLVYLRSKLHGLHQLL